MTNARMQEMERCWLLPPDEREKAISVVNAVFGVGPLPRMRRCLTCGESKPKSELFFCRRHDMADGLNNVCKVCAKEYQRKRREALTA